MPDLIPPSDLQAEQSILGACLLSADAVADAMTLLRPSDFYHHANRLVFEAVSGLFMAHTPVDLVTVSSALHKAGTFEQIGGGSYLTHITAMVPTAKLAPEYARLVRQSALLREIIDAGSELQRLGYDAGTDAEAAISAAEARLYALTQRSVTREPRLLRPILRDLADLIESRQGTRTTGGLTTGLAELDTIATLQPGRLWIVGARPSVGKSSLAAQIAVHVARQHEAKALVFSLEMTADALAECMVSSEGSLDGHRLGRGLLRASEYEALTGAMARLYDLPVWIDDAPALSASEVRTRARRHKARHGCDVVFVDHLQRIAGGMGQSPREKTTSNVQAMKTLARELNVPVVVLSQLRRSQVVDPNPTPTLVDLLESGYIEAEADCVLFPWREGYQDKDWDTAVPERAEIIVAKNREGQTGVARCLWQGAYRRFVDAAQDGEE